MTGFLNTVTSNFTNPMNRMTAAMKDLGYAAVPLGEPYELPAASAPGSGGAGADGIDIAAQEVLIEPLMRIE